MMLRLAALASFALPAAAPRAIAQDVGLLLGVADRSTPCDSTPERLSTYRDARHSRRKILDSRVEEACWDAQQRFLRQFPDGEWWIDRMRPKGAAA